MRTLYMHIISLLLIATVIHELDGSKLTVLSSRTDGVCVGDSLLFTCIANHTTLLSWFVEPVSSKTGSLQFAAQDQIGTKYNSDGFNATLVNKIPDISDYADLVSTLEMTITPELNGSRVCCSAPGNTKVYKDIMLLGPPSSPRSLYYTVLDGNFQNVTLLIQWSLQNDTTNEVEKFTVSIYSATVNYTVESFETTASLTLPYESYNISIKAISCGKGSKADVLHLNIIGCDHPRPPESGTMNPYHSLAEGSEISYHCNTGYAPHEEMTAVCTHQGVWSHNPNELECLRDCGTPRPPLNGYVEPYNSTVEGGEVFYQCREGYSPSGVRMRAVCTAEGMWNPNPSQLHCTGGVLDKSNWIIAAAIVGSSFLILILCVFSLGSLFLCWRKRHQRTTAATNEPPPAMVTVRSDPLYEEIPTQVGEESFVLKENAAYGPRPRIN